ncbi:MAG: amidohydrolase family protein [Bryobacterales bacterium]|nr:amidohydrolase [Bryobacteraceae bacterium]MDW8130743.1 amidohydrolase family protein [Bryobacterales bacterium]
MRRRTWLGLAAAVPALRAQFRSEERARGVRETDLRLSDFEPRSMLRVKQTRVERARFPVIDFHTHLSWSPGLGKEGGPEFPARPEEILPVMQRKNVRMMVNLTGGRGPVLEEVLRVWHKPHPDKFLVFTEPWWNRVADPAYPKLQADEIERAHKAGARGLKILKTLGLYLRENVTTGPLIKVDDRRFDPMWEAAGALKMPVAIHTSDPEAFFLPIDRFNERWEELHAHPDWSFHGKDFPSSRELHEARNRVMARHPRTQFVCLHMAVAEDLGTVSEWMDRYPNMWVEFGARIGELGRQPRTARRFFERYQDRILFGTDAVPHGHEYPQQIFCDELYEIYYRFLETEDEYFDYAPARIPPQGRWKIYGLGLPESILRKIYYENAQRLLGLA